MSSPIAKLPADLMLCICEHLPKKKWPTLMRVCKQWHLLIQPLLWTAIETHHRKDHVSWVLPQLREAEQACRKVSKFKRRHYGETSRAFLVTILTDKKDIDEERRVALGSMIRYLCLDIPGYPVPWSALAVFKNIEHLEISALWVKAVDQIAFVAPKCGLPTLRTLKLRGHFPREVVQWLLSEPENIEELQLAILDAPIGVQKINDEWENPPPPQNRHPFPLEDLPEDEQAWWKKQEDLTQGEWRALRPLACLDSDIMSRLKSLKKIYLCKTSSGAPIDFDILYFSDVSDRRILKEWRDLLRATRKTLVSVILDQRAVADENAPDGSGNNLYMLRSAGGPSYQRFVDVVLPTLLEKEEWPQLEEMTLFGFEIPDEGGPVDMDQGEKRAGKSVDLPGQLRAAFPDVQISNHIGSRMRSWIDSGESMRMGEDILCPSEDEESEPED